MRVYLDHNATAPLRAEAREAMLPWLGPPANPSSAHRDGARARAALEAARADVAALLGAARSEIVFTSGATEANNLALRGVLAATPPAARLVTTAIEHSSVLEAARSAVAEERLTIVGVDAAGSVDVDAVAAAATADTALVSVGLANGEVGSTAPVAEIADALAGRDVLLHVDAAQAVGRLPLDVHRLGVDLLSVSAHKIGGPTGIGALWVRPGVGLRPLLVGGPQERGRRAGTESVAPAVGFGQAARLARRELSTVPERTRGLMIQLWTEVERRVPGVRLNGPGPGRGLPNTLNVTFAGCRAESLVALLDLDGIATSAGSACAAGAAEPSHVLRAMGRDDEAARSGLRLSIGPTTRRADLDRLLEVLPGLVAQVRAGAAGARRSAV